MYGIFGSYIQPFVVTGIAIAASGIICVIINPIKKCLNKRRKEKNPNSA